MSHRPLDWAADRAVRVHLNLQGYPAGRPLGLTCKPIVGTWLSLVERTLGVGEVASSNLVVPTILFNQFEPLTSESICSFRTRHGEVETSAIKEVSESKLFRQFASRYRLVIH